VSLKSLQGEFKKSPGEISGAILGNKSSYFTISPHSFPLAHPAAAGRRTLAADGEKVVKMKKKIKNGREPFFPSFYIFLYSNIYVVI
jgi:hypothetical protein